MDDLNNIFPNMSVGANIRQVRKARNMTQKELGEKLGGISQQQIGQWENGIKNPKIETIQKIANALDVPLNTLVKQVLLGDSFIPSEWVDDKNYKPILDALEEEHRINSKSDTEILLPMDDALNQVYQNKLLSSFNKLNDIGKEKAIERVNELTEIDRYIQKD